MLIVNLRLRRNIVSITFQLLHDRLFTHNCTPWTGNRRSRPFLFIAAISKSNPNARFKVDKNVRNNFRSIWDLHYITNS